MQLVGTARPASTGPVISQQYVVFTVTPKEAMLTFNEQILTLDSDGVASQLVKFGTYNYNIQSEDYHPYTGSITVDDPSRKAEVSVQLKPAYGFLTVSGNAIQQASIYVDGKQIGIGQISKHKLSSGDHTLSVAKPLYKPLSQQFQITDGQTTTIQPNPIANFNRVTVNSGSAVEIWVNEEKKGTGSWSGNLAYGTYRIEGRKAGHRTSFLSKDIADVSGPQSISLQEPSPIYGGLNITSDPSNSDVSIDGKPAGRTPLLLSSTLIGRHTVSVSRNGYENSSKTVDLKEGEMLDVNMQLQKVPENLINGHEFVDLGLSVKWATCNIGANKPEEYGDYFAWGETSPKSSYDWENLKYRTEGYNYNAKFSKYVAEILYGRVDNRTRLELADDAARVNWGGSWRMPTLDEIKELKEQCSWQWTSVNGHSGYRVTSKRNGRSIFLPAAGYRYGSSSSNVWSRGVYWSSLLDTSNSLYAYYLYFNSSSVDWGGTYRRDGLSVRAVSK